MRGPTEFTNCSIAHFEGYVDDVLEDLGLERDVNDWVKKHPHYDIHHISYDHPGSSGYPLCATAYYTEMAYGRDCFVLDKDDSGVNLFDLRNVATDHRISLRRYDRHDGTMSVTIEDKEGSYVVEERFVAGGGKPRSRYYTLCTYCGRSVAFKDAVRISGSKLAHKECIPGGGDIDVT